MITKENQILIETYNELKSSYKVAKKLGISASKVKRILKKLNKTSPLNNQREQELKKNGFRKVANACKNRDKYLCQACNENKEGHLHAHHILPYWLCEDAFYDIDNLITLCSDCHKETGHLGDWRNFNIDLASDSLLEKYSFYRERLSGLAIYLNRINRCDSLNCKNKSE